MKRLLAFVTTVVMLLSVTACGADSGAEEKNGSEWPELITIESTTTGSSGYYICAAIGQTLTNHIEGVNVTAEATDGTSTTDAVIVQNDPECLGYIAVDAAQQLIDGTYPEMEGKKQDKLRLMMVGHATQVQFVTLKESGITSLDQLKGKRIATMNPGTATRVATLQILEALGYKESDFAALLALTPSDIADALKDGTVDVGVLSGSAPSAAVSDLNSTRDIVMLQVPQNTLDQIMEEHPGYRLYTITPDAYSDMTEDCTVVGLPMGMFCNEAMDEELVYQMTKALNENTNEVAAAHADGALWSTENTMPFYEAGDIAFHPGAIRYYEEIQANK